jgi:hypothetical protein
VGGPPGYQDYLEALNNPKHEEHETWLKWRGRFDPEAFSLAAVNEQLRKELRVTPRQKTVRNARNSR